MTAFLVLVLVWNAVAIAIGLRGWAKRQDRPQLARLANRQAAAALCLSLCFVVLGFAIRLPLVAAGVSSQLGDMATLIGWTFWATGGITPFTVTMLLRAGPRQHGKSGAEDDA
jgi:hypothetical protein